MFKVTLNGPVHIHNDNLAYFLSIVGPALVEPADEDTGDTGQVGDAGSVTAMAPARRGRKPKETPPAGAAAGAPAEAPAPPPPPAGNINRHNLVGGAEPFDRDALLEKFTALVDADYDKALEALTNFKVQRFSELTDDQLPEFAKAIS